MARTYILRNLTDDKGLALANVWCRAYNATTSALVETAYTDSAGTCTFTTLPEDANVNVCATWGKNVKWAYNVFSATQDLLYLSVTDAVIGTCSIGKLTAGNLAVTGTITTGKLVTGAADTNRIEIDASYIAGYNAANVLQFYLKAADGMAYFAGGSAFLNTKGLEMVGSGQMLRFFNTTYGATPDHILYWSAGGGIILQSNAGVAGISAGTDLWLTAVGKIFAAAATAIDFANIAYIDLPRFTFANTPATSEGRFGYNLTSHTLQFHNGTSWKTIATV